MKKITIFLIIILLTLSSFIPSLAYAPFYEEGIPVPEFKAATVDIQNRNEIMGYSKGGELIQNSIFTDTINHWAQKPITRMSAQSVVKGYGTHRFQPNDYITRQEVIALLVRMAGSEGEVLENLSNQGQGLTGNTINDIWAEGYIAEAQNLGILTGNEDGNFKAMTTREEVALWVANLLELEPVYDNIEILYTFRDWREVDIGNVGIIEAVLQERIMQGDANGNFKPKSYITRAEVASMLNNISDRLFEERNIVQNYGQILNIQNSTSREIGDVIEEKTITVKNTDGSVTSLITKTKSGEALNEFVTYKDGVVSSSNILNVGDEIEYLTKDNEVIYVEVYNDGSILEKIKENSMDSSDVRTYFGTITSISNESYRDGLSNLLIDRFRVRNIDGQVFDIVVETNQTTGVKNDVIVYKNGKVGGSNLLGINNYIEYVVKDNKNIVSINVTTQEMDAVKGTIKSVDLTDNRITLVDYDDETKTYGIVPYVGVTMNLRPATLSDLKFGQDVTLSLSNGLVTSIVGETFMGDPGYIPSKGKSISGKIKDINYDSIIVEHGDRSDNFRIYSDTRILKEGRSIRFKDLREGDKVKIYFDDIYSNEIVKIDVEGNEQLIKHVYKGELDRVDVSDNEITLTDPEILRNSSWKDLDDYRIDIQLRDNADIYYGGRSIDLEDLKDEHVDDDVYVAIEDSYGKDSGVKVVVKKGSERKYNEQIDDINYTAEEFELDNSKNISFDEGTIIIKDNRIVSASNLEEDLNALVVADYYSGDYNASVINIGNMGYIIFENIYVGKIEEIDTNDFDIEWYSELEEHEWDNVSSRSLNFDYTDDTYIVDVSNGYDEVDPYDFFHDGYSEEEEEDYYSFIVTDDDRNVIAMTLREDELFDDYELEDEDDIDEYIEDALDDLILTKGIVEEVDELRDRLQISDSYDWSTFLEEWKENRNDEYVDIPETLFIKGDEVIDVDDLDEGDTVYIIRDNEDGILVFVE